ncbi:hypothetical protein [Glycomyces sp. NPDC047010]|uniref:hypothetical protein n=1 Tax=Glycomyces sp. NPDC047010 TaxID=3155023 RepID=UPI0033D3F6F1
MSDPADRLRVHAEEFEPDSDRMWTRVAEGMRAPRGAATAPERARWRVPHLAMATGAAVVLIGGVVLFGLTQGAGPSADPDPAPPAAGPGAQTSESEASQDDTSEESSPDGPSGSGSSAEGGTETEETPEQPDWLWSEGAIDANNTDYFTQSTVKFRSDTALTGLEVELRLAEGDGLAYLDSWTTDDNLFTEAVYTSEDGYAVLRWTLKDGAVVPAGNEYTLAGQFDPNGGPRSGDADSFTVTATGEDGETGVLEGGF